MVSSVRKPSLSRQVPIGAMTSRFFRRNGPRSTESNKTAVAAVATGASIFMTRPLLSEQSESVVDGAFVGRQSSSKNGFGRRDPGAGRLVDADSAGTRGVTGEPEAFQPADQSVGTGRTDRSGFADHTVAGAVGRLLPQQGVLRGRHHLFDVRPEFGVLAVQPFLVAIV